MKDQILKNHIQLLFPFLETIIQDGGKDFYHLPDSVLVCPLFNIDGKSGYKFSDGSDSYSIEFGILLGKTGFFLRRSIESLIHHGERWEQFDYFNLEGEFTFSSGVKSLEPLYITNIQMDLNSPILNHCYNFLCHQYECAKEGKSWQTEQVYPVELFLRTLQKTKKKSIHPLLSLNDLKKDLAVKNIFDQILTTEMNPVLTWEERQIVFQSFHEKLSLIVETKIRAHKISKIKAHLIITKKYFDNFFARLKARPLSNFKGLFHQYTIGKIFWFFATVKNNLGYSVALAVYGPFTYYFITMPMNPHAMQAVGKVRSVYLDTKEAIDYVWSSVSPEASHQKSLHSAPSVPMKKLPSSSSSSSSSSSKNVSDEVSTQHSGFQKDQTKVSDNTIYESFSILSNQKDISINLGDGQTRLARASFLNMLLTTDVAQIDRQEWNERMSQFKQMQIAYEENMEFASRMGRLEQLETQYNFPMQIESTWEELERYNALIFKLRGEMPNLSAKMRQYLNNEINRTQQLELYLWDRMSRFILDQIYVMLDKDKEQKRNDYYIGRSFVFMQEMTNILSWRYKNFKEPQGHGRIKELADFYSKNRKEFGQVMKNLKENSDLFKQKDLLSTKEFRSYMKRQWEILYLQNSKAEEASNNGLNMYIWSVRNTAWILQSIYSAKKEELPILIKRDSSGQLLSSAELLTRSKVGLQYETLLHNLTLEYVGLREEIMNRLGKDIESTQRLVVLENLKEFISDREKLDGSTMVISQQSSGSPR